jgi:hypothetical protein
MDTTEFDASAGVPPEQIASVPAGGFEPSEVLHETADLDASRSVPSEASVALSLTIRLEAGIDPRVSTRELAELLHALHDYDLALGGSGLSLDRSRSRADDGSVTVVLTPVEAREARDRLQRMIELLEGPRNGDGHDTRADVGGHGLIDQLVSLLEDRHSEVDSSEQASARGRIRRWLGGRSVVDISVRVLIAA